MNEVKKQSAELLLLNVAMRLTCNRGKGVTIIKSLHHHCAKALPLRCNLPPPQGRCLTSLSFKFENAIFLLLL